MGGGTPVAEHCSSSGLSAAMVTSSGELELDIFGGSDYKEERFGSVVKLIFLQTNLELNKNLRLPSTVRLKLLVLLPAWLLATQL